MISSSTYEKYIQSAAWAQKRRKFIDSPDVDNGCYGCGKPYIEGFHLHHVTYERFTREDLDDLRMVCQRCHSQIHRLERDNGFTLFDATEAVRERYKKLRASKVQPIRKRDNRKPNKIVHICGLCKVEKKEKTKNTKIGWLHSSCYDIVIARAKEIRKERLAR